MSEEGATYVDPRLIKLKKRKDINHPVQERREFPWHIVAICLGILLLLATTGLGYTFFQCCGCRIQKEKQRIENNASSPAVEDHSVLSPSTEIHVLENDTCFRKWFCCGRNCYYFSKERKTWNESKTSCEGRGSHLIKIEDQEKQKFIQRKIQNYHWIGLYTKGANDTWKWLDGKKLSLKLNLQLTTPDAKCGQINFTNIASAVCTTEFHYICEKKFDMPDN